MVENSATMRVWPSHKARKRVMRNVATAESMAVSLAGYRAWETLAELSGESHVQCQDWDWFMASLSAAAEAGRPEDAAARQKKFNRMVLLQSVVNTMGKQLQQNLAPNETLLFQLLDQSDEALMRQKQLIETLFRILATTDPASEELAHYILYLIFQVYAAGPYAVHLESIKLFVAKYFWKILPAAAQVSFVQRFRTPKEEDHAIVLDMLIGSFFGKAADNEDQEADDDMGEELSDPQCTVTWHKLVSRVRSLHPLLLLSNLKNRRNPLCSGRRCHR
eukprot:TRINITY_DN5220_c0_g1_i1.p1 TRINITY_DN5220_c0_g1~~TRINITY_DN5220_c0_g1_i1.p1  ORF type:complete len:316 (-),score=67.72 TRINITY_DN5220_c0_g1_i1:326-1156(-)